MSLLRRNSVPDSVKERRLRPIYELLDSGNNKKVIQETDRLLKKQPNFACAKVLKALALLRMGKREECMNSVNLVLDECPTDENTIQAMAICYRELDLPRMVCVMIENACKKEKTEDLLTFCYMSHVRVMDFQKQHQTAMALYKAYPKIPYFSWAVMSLYAKATLTDDGETAQRVTLPLAERMMCKFLEDGQINTEHEYTLYILILFKMNAYMKAYQALLDVKKTGVQWTTGLYSTLMLACLIKTEQTERLREFLEELIQENTEDLKFYRQYVQSFGASDTERVTYFLKNLSVKPNTQDVLSRAAVIAQFLHYEHLIELKMEVPYDNIREALFLYLTKYGGKPFCLPDIKAFLKLVGTLENRQQMIEFVDKLINTDETTNIVQKIQRKTNFECLKYVFNRTDILTDQFRVLDYVGFLVKSYMGHRKELSSANIQFDPREIYPHDEYMMMIGLTLMETYWNSLNFWEGFYLTNDMRRFGLNSNTSVPQAGTGSTEGFNGIPVHVSDQKFNLPEEDFPILLSLAILEYGLQQSPNYAPLRILLGKTYIYCGAIVAGTDQFMRLDIKHAQIDSLGYLYLWKSLDGGVLVDAMRVANHAEAFYNNHHKECMEHVISAYKYGSWQKILEFLDFRDTIVNSLQANLLRVERNLLEYTMEANSRESSIRVAQKEGFHIDMAFRKEYEDSRDFRVQSFGYGQPVSKERIRLTHNDSMERLKVRCCFLAILNNFVRAMQWVQDEQKFLEYMQDAQSAFESLGNLMQNTYEEFADKVHERSVHGPWPPTIFEHCGSGFVNTFMDFVRVVFCTGIIPCPHDLGQLFDMVERSINDRVILFLCQWQKAKYSLVNLSNIIEEMYHVIQMVGYFCILADVLKCFLERSCSLSSVGSDTKSNKKRKPKETMSDAAWFPNYTSLMTTLVTCLKKLEDEVGNIKFASGTWFPASWVELQSMWNSKVSDEILNDILPYCLPAVTDKLNTSYYRAATEMRQNLSCKRKYIESVFNVSGSS